MPVITDPPPAKVRTDLDRLRARLDERLPAKQVDHNLLVATWNLRAFGGLTEKWDAGPDDKPKRDLHALMCIAEVVTRFDVIALQEVRGDIKALRHLLKALGDDWAFMLTDVTKGEAGNEERMAFLFDTRRVHPSGLACELVLPPEWAGRATGEAAALRQFARTPYALSFLATGHGYRRTFILVTVHVVYGQRAADRTPEVAGIAQWLADWARDVNGFDQNLIVLGDFNIDRTGDPNYEAFISTGLRVPTQLEGLPRTIFASGEDNYFDQIAWFTGEDAMPALSLHYSGNAGSVDFTDVVYPGATRTELSVVAQFHGHYRAVVEGLRPLPALGRVPGARRPGLSRATAAPSRVSGTPTRRNTACPSTTSPSTPSTAARALWPSRRARSP